MYNPETLVGNPYEYKTPYECASEVSGIHGIRPILVWNMPNVGMKVALYPGSDGNIEKAALFGMIALDWGTLGVSADDPFCVLDYQALKALVNNLPPPDPDAELVYSGGGSAYSLQTPSDKAGAIGGTVWNIVLAIVLATVIAVSVIAFVHIRKQKSPDKN